MSIETVAAMFEQTVTNLNLQAEITYNPVTLDTDFVIFTPEKSGPMKVYECDTFTAIEIPNGSFIISFKHRNNLEGINPGQDKSKQSKQSLPVSDNTTEELRPENY